MRNSLLFALLGALYIVITDGHLFAYDDEDGSHESGFRPSYYVSRSPPGKHSYSHRPTTYYPSYYISKTLPKDPNVPHGYAPVWDYQQTDDYHGGPHAARQGRSKKKKGLGWKGGWWYKKTAHGIISGRWGAPPPPGLEKEHYIYGGHGGQGWGWGGSSYGQQGWGGHHGGHHGGHRGHGPGGHGHHFPGGHGKPGHFGGHGHGGHGGGHGGGHYGGGWGWGRSLFGGGWGGWGSGYASGWGWGLAIQLPQFERAHSHWSGRGWERLSLGGHRGWGWK